MPQNTSHLLWPQNSTPYPTNSNQLTYPLHYFKTPQSIPPFSVHDHHVPLLPSAPPMNVKPYGYTLTKDQNYQFHLGHASSVYDST